MIQTIALLCGLILDSLLFSSNHRDGAQRKRFSIKKFAEKYNLEGPIAGNFMLAEYDDNVPAYHKRLNF